MAGTDDGGETDTDSSVAGEDPVGCACTTSAPVRAAWWAFALLGLGAVRRRRLSRVPVRGG